MRLNKLDQIKAEQLAHAETTGINPYQLSELAAVIQAPSPQALGDYQLAMQIDQGKISAVPDVDEKIKLKKSLIDSYLPFVDAYVASGDNYPNDVAVTVMIWLIDLLDIEHGLNLALHLIKQQQRMPAKFDRNMQTFICDAMYDWAAQCLKDQHSASPYLDVLVATMENDHWDVHPLCFSKLWVMLGKLKEQAQEYALALELVLKAEALNPEKAGVKGMKDRLQKLVNKE